MKHRLLFVALSLVAATSVAGSPASANVQSDGQPYGYVHMPSYPLLKGCWFYPFTYDVYLPDGTYQWTGSTQATDADGHPWPPARDMRGSRRDSPETFGWSQAVRLASHSERWA